MTSEKQIIANRKNALKWGVKTAKWKEKISRNAIKHWLNSLKISNESQGTYNKTLKILKEEIKPQTFTEAMIVDKLAIYHVKLNKLLEYETMVVEEKEVKKEPQKNDYPEWYPKELIYIQEKLRRKSIEEQSFDISIIDKLEKLQRLRNQLENRYLKLYKEILFIQSLRD